MVILRCIQKLLARLNLTLSDAEAAPLPPATTALGDWYATLLYTHPIAVVLCVSERSRLPVLLPARKIHTLSECLRPAAAELLRQIGIPEQAIAQEEREMDALCFASTRGQALSRSVLGTINDLSRMVKFLVER